MAPSSANPLSSPRSKRVWALTLTLTLLIVRFWKHGKSPWQDLFQKLPRPVQLFLLSQQKLVRRILQSLVGSTNNLQLSPEGARNDDTRTTTNSSVQQQNPQNVHENQADATIRENQALIRQVLLYWFGQYEPDEAQKKLWMIASSSTELRRRVDAEIAERFTPLLCELATDESERWNQWCGSSDQDDLYYGYQGKLAAIIVLDQYSRHIQRHYDEAQPNSETNDYTSDKPLPPQSKLDDLALRTAQLLTKHHRQEIQCGMIPLPQYIFGLMPYRHASTLETVQYVQNCVEKAASRNIQLEAMTSRFRKATNRRMAVLQDEARRHGKATVVSTEDDRHVETGGEDMDVPLQVASEHSTTKASSDFTDQDILEVFPFDADFTDAPHHPVVKTIQTFLSDRGIYPASTPATDPNQNTKPPDKQNQKGGKHSKQKQKSRRKHQPKSSNNTNNAATKESDPSIPCSLIVSLSGGVDSMIIASVLAYLKSKGGYSNLDIHAIHIDYANRPESKAESDYVQHYCQRLNIAFHVRRIEEVTRGITARDEYELMSRQVRYDMYRQVAQDCRERNTTSKQQEVGVMLGHHRGDLRENVLSNAHKGCGPLDLSGMTAVSENDGVTIYRPLLPLEKTDVFDFAHRYGVPYFKDTTPHWSTRGKLRNKLLPLLEEIYGEGSMNNLSTLAVESDECKELLHTTLLKPFMDSVVRKPMGISFETAPFVAQARGLFFWKFVLREVLHSAGLGMFSDKSVISFLERIRPEHTYKKTIRQGWLQCRRDYAVYLQQDGKVFIFYPASFPWRKTDAYELPKTAVEFSQNQDISLVVKPWTVKAEVKDVSPGKEREALVKKKAVLSMDQFMEGFVEYFLTVPTQEREAIKNGSQSGSGHHFTPAPLAFVTSFKKQTRPPAWKNADEKIQEVLPLLGNTEHSLQTITAANGADEKTAKSPGILVRITLDCRPQST